MGIASPRRLIDRSPRSEHLMKFVDESVKLVIPGFPRKQVTPNEGKQLVGGEPDDADHYDPGVYVLEVHVALLLVEKRADSRLLANELRDDKVRPSPADENSHIAVQVRECRWNDDMPEQLSILGSQGLGGLKQRCINGARRVRDDQNHLKEGSDENDCDLWLIPEPENGNGECAEHGCGHVSNEIDEWLE